MNKAWSWTGEAVKHAALIAVTMVVLLPVAWMISISLRLDEYVFSGHILWTGPINGGGYARALFDIPFFDWLWNSLRIGTLQTAGQLFVGVCAAFAFAYYRFPGRDALFVFVLMTMMIPMQVTLVPTYLIVSELGWLNSFTGVIVPHLASGFAIFLLRQSFLSVPKELAEAATIDGCGPLRIMGIVYVRLSGATIWTLGVLLFLSNFNEYNWPLLVMTDAEKMPLPLAFQYFRSETRMDWPSTMAVATLAMIPVLVLYLFAQRYIIDSFAQSGLKG